MPFATNGRLNSMDQANMETEVGVLALNIAKTLTCEYDLETAVVEAGNMRVSVIVHVASDGDEHCIYQGGTTVAKAFCNEEVRELSVR